MKRKVLFGAVCMVFLILPATAFAAGFDIDVTTDSFAISDTETTSLFMRGGLYADPENPGGVWISLGGENIFPEDMEFSYKNVTVGADKRFKLNYGTLWLGLLAGYGHATKDMPGGGDLGIDSKYVGIYAAYLHKESGIQLLSHLRYNRYDADVKLDVDSGDFQRDAYTFIINANKSINIGNDGWYIQPQLQYQVTDDSSVDFRTKNKIRIHSPGTTYSRLYGGLGLGRVFNFNGAEVDLYGDVGIEHEFGGAADFNIAMANHSVERKDTYGCYGIGANIQFSPGKYIHARLQHCSNSDDQVYGWIGFSWLFK